MNTNNTINRLTEKEIKNKLENFEEGKDYSVVPTEEPDIKTYTFNNDKLRSIFGGERVPLRIRKENYDGADL